MSRRSEIRERWRRILREQRASGLSVSDFCRRAGVQHSGYYKWRRKLDGEVAFAEVKVRPVAKDSSDMKMVSSDERVAANGGDLELRLPGRRSVVVPRGFDRQTLRDLLDVLEGGAAEIATREAGR